MSQTAGAPDVLVRGQDGQIYYAPGSSFKPVKVPPDHPVMGLFKQVHPGPGSLPTLTGSFSHEGFATDDGQGAQS